MCRLSLLGDRLEILYVPIRHKLSVALTNWHPSDPSAKLIIEPWIQVFQSLILQICHNNVV